MFKHLFTIIFSFFIGLPVAVYAQTPTDTTVSIKDTVVVEIDSSDSGIHSSDTVTQVLPDETKEDSIYIPVRDSAYRSLSALRQVPRLKVEKYRADADYEYANNPEYWVKDKVQNNPGSSAFWNFLRNKTFQWFLFLLVIAVIVYGIILLAKENSFKWFSLRSADPQPDEPDSLLQGPMDYDEAIRKYRAEGNYRFAIRYLYLRLLHLASEKNIVPIRRAMTNTEIGQAFGKHPLASQFRYLATAYEYIFFGDFKVNEEIFDRLNAQFEIFNKNYPPETIDTIWHFDFLRDEHFQFLQEAVG